MEMANREWVFCAKGLSSEKNKLRGTLVFNSNYRLLQTFHLFSTHINLFTSWFNYVWSSLCTPSDLFVYMPFSISSAFTLICFQGIYTSSS